MTVPFWNISYKDLYYLVEVRHLCKEQNVCYINRVIGVGVGGGGGGGGLIHSHICLQISSCTYAETRYICDMFHWNTWIDRKKFSLLLFIKMYPSCWTVPSVQALCLAPARPTLHRDAFYWKKKQFSTRTQTNINGHIYFLSVMHKCSIPAGLLVSTSSVCWGWRSCAVKWGKNHAVWQHIKIPMNTNDYQWTRTTPSLKALWPATAQPIRDGGALNRKKSSSYGYTWQLTTNMWYIIICIQNTPNSTDTRVNIATADAWVSLSPEHP